MFVFLPLLLFLSVPGRRVSETEINGRDRFCKQVPSKVSFAHTKESSRSASPLHQGFEALPVGAGSWQVYEHETLLDIAKPVSPRLEVHQRAHPIRGPPPVPVHC